MKTIKMLLFTTLIFIILMNSYTIMESIRFSFSICINNLFPSLIPFMLLSNILINYDFISDLSNIFNKVMKLFKISKNCSFIFIMSILSGTPSNSKYIKDLLDNDLISIEDAKKCLNFCHFTNPIFIIGTIGYTFLGNKKMGLIILISHYLSSITIGLFNKGKTNYYNKINKSSINKKGFINILTESINSTISTLLLILGIITVSLIITCILDKLLNIPSNYKFIYGLIEITQGLKYLSLSNFNIELKSVLSSIIISFGGICIHAQVFSILDNKKIRYTPYLLSRIFHSILSGIITFILIMIFY